MTPNIELDTTMVYQIFTGGIGVIIGSGLGIIILLELGVSGGGLSTLIDVIAPSVAGATIGAPLGILTGITGGIIGGLIGVIFVLLPTGNLLIHAPISWFVASIVTAFVLSGLISLLIPH